MTYMLNSIEDAIDRKFLVVTSLKGQVQAGTVVHIMNAYQANGGVVVDYRDSVSGMDHTVKFPSIKDFYKWARPDNFIARYYDRFSVRDIQQYIKLTNRTFKSFCLPIIIAAVILVWIVCLLFIPNIIVKLIVAVALSIMVAFAIWSIYKNHHTKVMMKLYRSVSADWAAGGLVIR
ncbi:MAG: hypothetical protein IKH75_22480 [Ruminococcus sp.]|nr:hypothetical protein [Ruminococcus sp.]